MVVSITRYSRFCWCVLTLALLSINFSSLLWSQTTQRPNVVVGSYDWMERWVVNSCSKNRTDKYCATIQVANHGDSDAKTVSIVIANDVNGVYFIKQTPIAQGLVVRPSESYDIEVCFSPQEERVYYADGSGGRAELRYIYTDGYGNVDSTIGFLEGIGIESYITVSDFDFGRIEYIGPGENQIAGKVLLAAHGTRPVTITEVRLSDSRHFRMVSSLPLPISITPGETHEIDVFFTPQDADPTVKRATIDVIGDFAFAGCSKTDSSGALVGEVYTVGAEVEGVDFGSILTCYEEDGEIVVRNVGTEPLTLTSISQAAPAGSPFIVDPDNEIHLPLLLAPQGDAAGGDVLRIPVRFVPSQAGNYSAHVVIHLTDNPDAITLTASLTGIARTMSVNVRIPRDIKQNDENPIRVPVLLEDDPAEASVTELLFTMDYDMRAMLLGDYTQIMLGEMFPNNQGWALEIIDIRPGVFTLRIYNTEGRCLEGTGELLDIPFWGPGTYAGFPEGIEVAFTITKTEVPFNITPVNFGQNNNPCIEFTTSSGLVCVDDLSEANSTGIVDVSPNPVKDNTTITFSLEEAGDVQIGIYTTDGRRVVLLVDEEMEKGIHSVVWDSVGEIEGPYYVYLKVGDKKDSRAIAVLR